VISGKARVTIEGGTDEHLSVGDVITVPCWHAHSLIAEQDAIVFQVTDEPLLAKVGLVKTG
jgi:gentisate 1,2-dioxygenase